MSIATRGAVRPRPPSDGERGAVAVVVALSLTVLLGFTALVVDVGLGWAARAQAQTAVDAAALAGAARLPADPAGALAAVRAVLADDLDGATVPAGLGWAGNADEADGDVRCWRPPDPPPAVGTPCAAGTTAIRVLTPPVRARYAFAGVLGRDTTDVKAAAVAGVFSSGQVLPWGLLAGEPVPPAGRVCLVARPALAGVGPCPPSPSPRPLDSPRAGCVQGRAAYVANLAAGIDHPLSPDAGEGVLDTCDPDGTPTELRVGARRRSATGSGLLGEPGGRLRAAPALGGRVLGAGWDGDFLDPADAAAPAGLPVTPGYTGGGFFRPGAGFATYLACVAAPAAPGCQSIFSDRIAASPRFCYLPVLAPPDGSAGWPAPGGRLRIVGFRAAFIELPMDAAGRPVSAPGSVALVSLQLLPAALLPDDLVGPAAGAVAWSGGPRTVHLTG
jgi:hypothetical protein